MQNITSLICICISDILMYMHFMPFLLTIASFKVAICRFVIACSLRDTNTSTRLRYGLISINDALADWLKILFSYRRICTYCKNLLLLDIFLSL